jgi:hypothetical protein
VSLYLPSFSSSAFSFHFTSSTPATACHRPQRTRIWYFEMLRWGRWPPFYMVSPQSALFFSPGMMQFNLVLLFPTDSTLKKSSLSGRLSQGACYLPVSSSDHLHKDALSRLPCSQRENLLTSQKAGVELYFAHRKTCSTD